MKMPNDILIRTEDLHEIRTYNNAIRMANGEFVVLLQDDDVLPSSDKWVKDAISLFREFPKLAVLGGRRGNAHCPKESEAVTHQRDWKACGYKSRSGIPCMFFAFVDIAPMFLRKKAVLDAGGGFDLSLASPGKPGIYLDVELCFRLWLAGHQVAIYDASFKNDAYYSGTKTFDPESRAAQFKKNAALTKKVYGSRMGVIQKMVNEANNNLALTT